ncbi:hypothetical protein [Falsiroseomonas oryzae]|uniref:hypothetical protein n=1 Tax=Falsiroseomonas oryzae TaxID=2766473 RepID=UPI0022EB81B3|nr:hypothetical protein [Roseomonas sp. MO-31]
MANPVHAWRRLPVAVRFLVSHGMVGFGLSALFVAGLLLTDYTDAAKLLLNSAGHWWPALVLWFFVGLTFGSVQIGVATMLLADDPRQPPPRRGSGAPSDLALVPLRVRARRR